MAIQSFPKLNIEQQHGYTVKINANIFKKKFKASNICPIGAKCLQRRPRIGSPQRSHIAGCLLSLNAKP